MVLSHTTLLLNPIICLSLLAVAVAVTITAPITTTISSTYSVAANVTVNATIATTATVTVPTAITVATTVTLIATVSFAIYPAVSHPSPRRAFQPPSLLQRRWLSRRRTVVHVAGLPSKTSTQKSPSLVCTKWLLRGACRISSR